jgi:hypothetical protein
MIKFVSRTELYLPAVNKESYELYELMVNTGDKVRAGITPLVRYSNG